MHFCVLQNIVTQKQSVKTDLKVLGKYLMEIIVCDDVMKLMKVTWDIWYIIFHMIFLFFHKCYDFTVL